MTGPLSQALALRKGSPLVVGWRSLLGHLGSRGAEVEGCGEGGCGERQVPECAAGADGETSRITLGYGLWTLVTCYSLY